MKKLDIALLSGGDSPERDIAIQSALQVADSLDKDKYNVYPIDILGRDWNYDNRGERISVDKNDFSVTIDGMKIVFDYALIIIHGTPGEDGMLQGYLDMMKIPYSSCGLVSTAVTFDKTVCKKVVSAAGVQVAREIFLRKGESFDPVEVIDALGLPLFVKPNASGSSFGVSKVKEAADLAPAIDRAFAEGDAVLIEEFIGGREFGCGIYITQAGTTILPLTEIVSRNEFFDYQAKYTPGFSEEITPAQVDTATEEAIKKQAETAYRACGCRGLVRIDFIVPGDGTPVMVEVNTIPGMSSGSIVPKQAACAGTTIGRIFEEIIEQTRK